LTDQSIEKRGFVRAGAVQLNSTEDIDRNLETADRLVRDAAARGAELVVLPEKWSLLGTGRQIAVAAQPLDGSWSEWAAGLALELGIDLVSGSVAERRPGSPKSANTSVHFGPDGRQRAVYRKLHMFDVEVDGTVYAESEHEQAGDEVVVSELEGGARLGMAICYDLRFPELFRMLALGGAQIISLPSAFTLATTRDHWEVLLRARAIENECFVIAPNQIGTSPPGNRSGGRSMIVDPWGLVLASAPDIETAIVADLDLEVLQDVRRRLPVLEHRRTDAYGWSL
jgi:predicted amidohydrolase